MIKGDSQLVISHVRGDFQAKEPQFVKYVWKIKKMIEEFKAYTIEHIPQEQNFRADLLSKLASTKAMANNRSVIQE